MIRSQVRFLPGAPHHSLRLMEQTCPAGRPKRDQPDAPLPHEVGLRDSRRLDPGIGAIQGSERAQRRIGQDETFFEISDRGTPIVVTRITQLIP